MMCVDKYLVGDPNHIYIIILKKCFRPERLMLWTQSRTTYQLPSLPDANSSDATCCEAAALDEGESDVRPEASS
ncbi:hypothetical protein B9Z55_014501 [Caenorhabditis nigoni]|uniref:Uncharacterized protein n=2 Tax=Caenorhabditis nigoni TaxID=1611254 RepID=A0A2G5U645_9PELO|nr:hypothetical protein B9Z55_014501 [Caenorhabditis nigoni]